MKKIILLISILFCVVLWSCSEADSNTDIKSIYAQKATVKVNSLYTNTPWKNSIYLSTSNFCLKKDTIDINVNITLDDKANSTMLIGEYKIRYIIPDNDPTDIKLLYLKYK